MAFAAAALVPQIIAAPILPLDSSSILPRHHQINHEHKDMNENEPGLYAPSTEPHVLPTAETSSNSDATLPYTASPSTMPSDNNTDSSTGPDVASSAIPDGLGPVDVAPSYSSNNATSTQSVNVPTSSASHNGQPAYAMDGPDRVPLGSTFDSDASAPLSTGTVSDCTGGSVSSGTGSGLGPMSTGFASAHGVATGFGGDPKMGSVEVLPGGYSGSPVRRSVPRRRRRRDRG